MIILLINSTDDNSFAALYDGNKIHVSYSSDFKNSSSKKQPDNLINCLYSIAAAHREKFEQAQAIAVTIGPGSFTGIRVGLAIAKGAADALGVPIIPLTNFEVIYKRIPNRAENVKYCILIPAKHPEYYFSVWQNDNEIEKGYTAIDNLSDITRNNTVIVGNLYAETDRKHSYFEHIQNKDLLPETDVMLRLAIDYFKKPMLKRPGEIEPLYLKDFAFKKHL